MKRIKNTNQNNPTNCILPIACKVVKQEYFFRYFIIELESHFHHSSLQRTVENTKTKWKEGNTQQECFYCTFSLLAFCSQMHEEKEK